MKIQVLSDLHTEFVHRLPTLENFNIKVSPEADLLVLAGDIATKYELGGLAHLLKQLDIPVIYVPGNHEFYGSSVEEMNSLMKYTFENSNVIPFINPTFIKIEGVNFIGGTLWTELDPIAKHGFHKFADGQLIQDLTQESWLKMHADSVATIETTLQYLKVFDPDSKVVVISHHLPTPLSTPARFKASLINGFFNTDLGYLMDGGERLEPSVWIHGHTHDSFDYTYNKTRIVCNPYGYDGRETNPLFDPEFIIEV